MGSSNSQKINPVSDQGKDVVPSKCPLDQGLRAQVEPATHVAQAQSTHPIAGIKDLCAEYRQYALIEKGLTPGTWQSEDYGVRWLEKFAATCSKDLLTLTPRHIEALPDYLRTTRHSDPTVQTIMSSVHRFYFWLQSAGRIEYDPTAFTKFVYKRPKTPRSVSEEQLAKVLGACERDSKYAAKNPFTAAIALRDYAILEFLYASLIRNTELVTLKPTNVDFDNRRATVYGKKGRARGTSMTERAALALERYLKEARPILATGKPPKGWQPHKTAQAGRKNSKDNAMFFLSKYGEALSPAGLASIVRSSTKIVSPHMLRHSGATHMLDHGAEIKQVQEILGHGDLKSTNIYVRKVQPKQVRETHDRCHPGAKWRPASHGDRYAASQMGG
jgi:site-specific recombinase XerD